MPSSIYIEDNYARLTIVSAQPLGASSLNEGEIEVSGTVITIIL